ncbi:MAG: metallophosphoesterase [Verrucomicrobia bacterium]|nr:metallophosphoesterase [Verrucomicrobiota bacterium]
MKLLVTSDLHLVRFWRPPVLKLLGGWIRELRPDGLLIAGDIAVPAEADTALRELRQALPDGPIITALGNHDFWANPASGCSSLEQVIQRFWWKPADLYEVALLDVANFHLDELVFVGGYGHYDLGFACPDLCYNGRWVNQQHYLTGRPPTETALRWRDFDWMPGANDLPGLATAQVDSVQTRLVEARTTPVMVALHTPPFSALLGIPDTWEIDPENPPIRAFFRAYLGNRSMGEMLEVHSTRICGLVCGHTHRPAGPFRLNGFMGVNVGSDYGTPRALILDTRDMSLTRVELAVR